MLDALCGLASSHQDENSLLLGVLLTGETKVGFALRILDRSVVTRV